MDALVILILSLAICSLAAVAIKKAERHEPLDPNRFPVPNNYKTGMGLPWWKVRKLCLSARPILGTFHPRCQRGFLTPAS